MNIINLADDNIRKNGEKLAIVFNEKEYTNVWIDEKARKLATGLKSLGIGRGDHVVVSMPNSPEVFVAFQAVWLIGAVIIPIMFLLGEEETRYILDHSDAKAVITSHDLLDKIVNAKEGLAHIENVIVLDGGSEGEGIDFYDLTDQSPAETNTEDMGDDDVALMIYTSGTTGKPKGVMLTHRNLYSNARAAWESNEWDKAPVSVLCLPMAHSFGVVAMNAGNLSPYPGSFAVLMTWFDPEEVFRLIEKYKANNFIGVPTMYQLLLAIPEADKYDTGSLERCIISAAPVSEELYRAFTTKFNCTMYEGYGLTEAAPAVALCRPGMPLKNGSCGVPLPGVEVAIVDNEDNPLPAGEQGEILVRGENVMKGYYKRPEETKEALKGGWLHTGDIGYLDEDNYLFI
ncbi:MAG: AMP-binding protein, partial [Deltaproteobacteria bacterium]|nr:AMP-binding protein [Deltaproteobacteria bacterium]